jgi:putative hemolysin
LLKFTFKTSSFSFLLKNCPQQVNGLIGGAVAGAAVAARTRSWLQVIGMAGLVSVFCAAADYSRT